KYSCAFVPGGMSLALSRIATAAVQVVLGLHADRQPSGRCAVQELQRYIEVGAHHRGIEPRGFPVAHPIKWIEDRREHLLTINHQGHDRHRIGEPPDRPRSPMRSARGVPRWCT